MCQEFWLVFTSLMNNRSAKVFSRWPLKAGNKVSRFFVKRQNTESRVNWKWNFWQDALKEAKAAGLNLLFITHPLWDLNVHSGRHYDWYVGFPKDGLGRWWRKNYPLRQNTGICHRTKYHHQPFLNGIEISEHAGQKQVFTVQTVLGLSIGRQIRITADSKSKKSTWKLNDIIK